MIRAGDSHTPIGSQSVFESNPQESKAFVRAGEQANQKALQSVFESTPAAPKAMVRASDEHAGGVQHKLVFESAPRATNADVVHGQDIEYKQLMDSNFGNGNSNGKCDWCGLLRGGFSIVPNMSFFDGLVTR